MQFTTPSTLAIAQDIAASEPAGSVLAVNTIVATTETSVQQTRDFSGIVAARRSSDLSFERPGRVVQVLVSEGDRVEAEQLLAQLDRRLLEKKKTDLDEALERAQADLAALDPESPQATPAQLQA
ncbi:MAG: biotin/lipoyl-binding protein, partial [Planctomycetota bacterium]